MGKQNGAVAPTYPRAPAGRIGSTLPGDHRTAGFLLLPAARPGRPFRVASPAGLDQGPEMGGDGADQCFGHLWLAFPLVVDLDGTLTLTETLNEGFAKVLFRDPGAALAARAAERGARRRKRDIASVAAPTPPTSPYWPDLIHIGRAAKARGRAVHLATAADQAVADEGRAPSRPVELAAGATARHRKTRTSSRTCKARFPVGLIYAGDGSADLPVFCGCARRHPARCRRLDGERRSQRQKFRCWRRCAGGEIRRKLAARLSRASMGEAHSAVRAAVRRTRVRQSRMRLCRRRSAPRCCVFFPRRPQHCQ